MAKSVWDEVKDLFKSEEQKAADRQKQIDDALEREKEVVDQLDELDRQYRESVEEDESNERDELAEELEKLYPSDSGYREKEYDAETDEEIESRAREESAASKKQEQDEYERKYNENVSSVEEKKDAAGQSLKDSFKQLEQLYGELRQRAKDDALKRGVARSSIVSSKMSGLENAESGEREKARYDYIDKIGTIDRQLEKLSADRDYALEQLDIEYAKKLADNIAKLKEDRDKEVQKYEDYNAEVRRKNADYAAKRERDVDAYVREREKEKEEEIRQREQMEQIVGYTGEKRENYAKRYEIAYDFYTSLSPDIALDALMASPNMRYYLGEHHYTQLYNSLRSLRSAMSDKTHFI